MPRKPIHPPLTKSHPDLIKQWHPTKNGDLTPELVTQGSQKKVWWKCLDGKWSDGTLADDHEWESNIDNRALKGQGCPMCNGKSVVPSNCLETTHPHIAKEWHPSKNSKSTKDVTIGSGYEAIWICQNSIKNGEAVHIWSAPVYRRKVSGCPICVNQKIIESKSLASTHPILVKELHPFKSKNFDPSKVSAGSNKKVWWKCFNGKWPNGTFADDHEWQSIISSRALNNVGCPFCAGKNVAPSMSIVATHPDLAGEWHPSKNGDLKPIQFNRGSNKQVWWYCDKGVLPNGEKSRDHEWSARINHRVLRRSGCPCCSGRKAVISNSLATWYPKLAQEWHPSKNIKSAFEYVPGSNEKVWWICSKDREHEWPAVINSRTQGKGCPFCVLTPQSKQELTVTFELKLLFPEINPKGFKTVINNKTISIDIYIPSINLGIEFDGSYWHKNNEKLDLLKSLKIKESGFHLLRIRQEPLEKLGESIIASKKFNGKQIADDIFCYILNNKNTFKLKRGLKQKMNKYLNSSNLQNENALIDYIELLLNIKKNSKTKSSVST